MKRAIILIAAAATITILAIAITQDIKETAASEELKLETPKALAREQEDEPDPEPDPEPGPRTYNGIAEGDVITGELTHYCVCEKCCGKTDGITASGLKIENGAEPEIPVAACNWLPFGTIIRIEGKTHVIADRGGSSLNKIGRLDIFTPEGHQAALELGRIKGAEIKVVSLPEEREEWRDEWKGK